MAGENEILSKIFDFFLTSTNVGGISGGILTASLLGNWYLYRKLGDYKELQISYERLCGILEPIFTKLIDNEKILEKNKILSPSDIGDLKNVRNIMKFKGVLK